MKRPTKKQLKALYEAHVRRYEGRLVKARGEVEDALAEQEDGLSLYREDPSDG